jgi:hypothetical protein
MTSDFRPREPSALQDLTVVGVFRSGTNLMKLLLEDGFHVRCSFNQWAWKHGIPPTLFSGARHLRPAAPFVIMVKEPVHQNVSLFHHWRRTRPQLLGTRNFSQFIRTELIVHDNSFGGHGPKYAFPTPTDYWNAFYFSYLHWDDIAATSLIVRLDQLESDPSRVLGMLERKFSLARRRELPPVIPANKVRPSADGRSAQVDSMELHSSAFEVSPEDRDFILSRASAVILDRLFRP